MWSARTPMPLPWWMLPPRAARCSASFQRVGIPPAAPALADGRLVVLNGKGSRSYPNPKGPNPATKQNNLAIQYVAHTQTGSASFIPKLTDEALDSYTAGVKSNSPYSDEKL